MSRWYTPLAPFRRSTSQRKSALTMPPISSEPIGFSRDPRVIKAHNTTIVFMTITLYESGGLSGHYNV